MLDFLQNFFIAMLFVAAVFLLTTSICSLIELAIRSTVSDEFQKLEQRFRERETERHEREKRQQEHEQRMQELRGLSTGV
jgi:sensor histidine kinase YesM